MPLYSLVPLFRPLLAPVPRLRLRTDTQTHTQTHTQDNYRNPPAHARRGLITAEVRYIAFIVARIYVCSMLPKLYIYQKFIFVSFNIIILLCLLLLMCLLLLLLLLLSLLTLGACAARVTVVVVCVCLSVCLLFDNSLHEWLFASKTNTHIQRRMEVKKYVGFSLKLLRSRVMASFTHLE